MSALTPNYAEFDFITMKSIAAASIVAGYTLVTSIFGSGVVQLILYSSLDATVQLSLDGVRDFIPIPAGGTLIIDVKSNVGALSGAFGVYVKDLGNPTTGSLYVSGFVVKAL